MKKFLRNLGLGCALAASVLTASAADLEETQVGTIVSGRYTSKLPFGTDYACGGGISLYRKGILGLESGQIIKELKFFGYAGYASPYGKYASIDIYLQNVEESSTDLSGFINASNGVNTETMTHFATIEDYDQAKTGSNTDLSATLLDFTNNEGFEYTGGNIVVYVVAKGTDAYGSLKFASCYGDSEKNNTAYQVGGCKTKSSGAAAYDTYSWTTLSNGTAMANFLPVMKIGYQNPVVDGVVSGTVTNSVTGAALKGATVDITRGVTTVTTATDADGKYSVTIPAVEVDEKYDVKVTCGEYTEYNGAVYVPAELAETLNIKLDYSATITGKVTCGDDAVAGATVAIKELDLEATTAEDGTYTIAIEKVAAEKQAISVTCDGFTSGEAEAATTVPGSVTTNFALLRIGTINGVVTNKVTEAALAGAKVVYGTGNEAIETVADTEGKYTFSITGVALNTEYDLSATAEGYNAYAGKVTFTANATPAVADIALDFDVTIAGVVSNLQGETANPVAGATITIGEGETALTTTSDTEGKYSIAIQNVAAAEQTLNVVAAGFASVSVKAATTAPGDVEANIALEAQGKISGEVRNAVTNALLGNVAVTLTYGENELGETKSDAQGTYSFDVANVQFDSEYSLEASIDGYQDLVASVTFAADALEVTQALALYYGATISGTVTTEVEGASTAVEGATVTIGEGETALSATTDAQGKYSIEIETVEAEKTVVNVACEGYKAGNVEVTTAAPGEYTGDVVLVKETEGIALILNAEREGAQIFTIDGRRVEGASNLAAGLYIIRTATSTTKVLVK